jgi:hypothetical protein
MMASESISMEAALLAFNLLQLAAQGVVGSTHPVPPDQQQDCGNAARQNRERQQEDGKEHPHDD